MSEGVGDFAFVSNSPVDRLTRICDRLIEALCADPEYVEGDTAILMLDCKIGDTSLHTAGIGIHNIEDPIEYFMAMISHMKGTAQAIGLKVNILGANSDGEVMEL